MGIIARGQVRDSSHASADGLGNVGDGVAENLQALAFVGQWAAAAPGVMLRGSTCRSGCGIRPKTNPVESQTPAMSSTEPLGLSVSCRPAPPVAGRHSALRTASSGGDEFSFAVGDRQVDWAEAPGPDTFALARVEMNPAVDEATGVVVGQRGGLAGLAGQGAGEQVGLHQDLKSVADSDDRLAGFDESPRTASPR